MLPELKSMDSAIGGLKERTPCSASRFPLTPNRRASRSAARHWRRRRGCGAPPSLKACVPIVPSAAGSSIYTKAGKIIDIEGNPESPINEGTLCPKGANAFQLAVNPHRVTRVLYRAPFSDQWETRSLDWALDQIARRMKAARDADFTERNEAGRLLNSVRSVGTLGGATIDNEENYLIKKLFGGGLGVVSIENQARI